MRPALLLSILVGCLTQKDPLGGEEGYPIGGEGDGVGSSDGGGSDSADGGGSDYDTTVDLTQECDPEDTGPSELTVGVVGDTAQITHQHLVLEDCGTWYAAILVDRGDHSIAVAYRNDDASGCEDTCGWTMSYDVSGLSNGDWTISAAGDTESFTVAD